MDKEINDWVIDKEKMTGYICVILRQYSHRNIIYPFICDTSVVILRPYTHGNFTYPSIRDSYANTITDSRFIFPSVIPTPLH